MLLGRRKSGFTEEVTLRPDQIPDYVKEENDTTFRPFFMASPYNMTKTQIDVALDMIKRREEYADIQETQSFNGKRYLYTSDRLTAKYAKALADFAEEGEHNM